MNNQNIRVDLISDTATRPSTAMLHAMSTAQTGDEQRDEDPTTIALETRMAAILGHEKGLFLPSGTMCNQISFLVHCRAGDEIICSDTAHVFGSEGAGAAALAGAQFRPIISADGIYSRAQAEALIRAPRHRSPRSRVIAIEQTTNRGGGQIWPVSTIRDLASLAADRGLALHMDGARLFDASVAAGVAPSDFAGPCDSVWVDLSKGLGCPFGAVLCGSAEFIAEALIWKHRLGGAMRQSGYMAAAGVYALEHNIDRLAEDHAKARRMANILSAVDGLIVTPKETFTNIVFLDLSNLPVNAGDVAERVMRHGIRINVEGPKRIRLVTHLDVSHEGADFAATAIQDTLSEMCGNGSV